MSTESKVDILQHDLAECKKSLERANSLLSNFVLSYIAVAPTLLRIMERFHPNDGDVRYLIDLFQRCSFDFDNFRDQHQAILEKQPNRNEMSWTQKTDVVLQAETKLFVDLIRRSYNSMDSESQVEIGEMACL